MRSSIGRLVRLLVVVLLGAGVLLPGFPAQAATGAWAGDPLARIPEVQPGEGFGTAVVTAGDLDGDGRNDLAVGAPDAGKVYLYYGTPEGYRDEPDRVILAPAAGIAFGESLAPAGDVNGDGWDDLLVGAPGDAGHVYVYCGGPGGPPDDPCWEAGGTDPGEELGRAVARAGDLDGDGIADILVGAPGWNGNKGRVLLFPGSPAGPAETPAWEVTGTAPGERFGAAIASALDVTGDGWPDVLVGAPAFAGQGADQGRVLLFRGGAGGPEAAPAWEFRGDPGDRLGRAVALPGDLDGDGQGDLAVGAPGRGCEGRADAGAVLGFRGGDGGPGDEPRWSVSLACEAGVRLGESVAAVGDVDGDALADLAAGAPGREGGRGAVVILFGRRSGELLVHEVGAPSDATGLHLGSSVGGAGDPDGDGFAEVAAGGTGVDATAARVLVLAGARRRPATEAADWVHYGEQPRAQYGYPVASAGDVNGDGYDDILVGDFSWDEGTLEDAGRVDLYLGGPDGPEDHPSWTFRGDQAGAQLGIAIGSAGDVNGDGYDDFLVSAWRERVEYADEGVVYLFLGGPGGPGAAPDWSYRGGQYGAQLGLAVLGAGDVNGDGFADFVLTSPYFDNDRGGEGRVFLFRGSVYGPGATPDWTWDPDWRNTWFGTMAGGAGDVNGDGYDDVFVTDMEYSHGESTEGLVLVFHGGPDGPAPEPSWSWEENRAHVCVGYSAAAAGDVNGDGYDDLVVSGAGNWYVTVQPDMQVVHVFHGSPGGLGDQPAWTRHGYEADGDYGSDVSTAGDVNGDGYADILVGSDWYSLRGLSEEGRVDLHLGGPGGVGNEPAWTVYGGQPRANLGVSCRLAGDVNGDGVPDLLLDAQYLEQDMPEQGAALLYLGDRGGRPLLPRQLDPDGERIVPVLSRPRSTQGFRVGLEVGHPLGLGRVRLVAEARPTEGSSPWERRATAWRDGAGRGLEEEELIFEHLSPGTRYTWRARIEMEGSPFQRTGPWVGPVRTSPGRPKLSTDVDLDGDDQVGLADCDDGDPAAWRSPGEARNLRFEDKTTLAWDPPLDPGGDPGTLRYDTLRANGPGEFGAGECLETDGDDETTADEDAPHVAGWAFYYLVRAENGCPRGGSLGRTSSGEEREGRSCP